jgi:hypothetical protein
MHLHNLRIINHRLQPLVEPTPRPIGPLSRSSGANFVQIAGYELAKAAALIACREQVGNHNGLHFSCCRSMDAIVRIFQRETIIPGY